MTIQKMVDRLGSPRLAALRAELDAGNTHALDEFWREVEAGGAPLVEAVRGDDDYCLVTFLWRGDDDTRNVVVASDLVGWDFASNQMNRLPATNVWHKSYRVPGHSRATYALSPNDSLLPLEEVTDWEARMSTWRADPLNPDRYVISSDRPGDTGGYVCSVIELPGSPPRPWIRQPLSPPKGQVELHDFRSEILGNERRVWVYTPPGYLPEGGPYGVMVMLDGETATLLMDTPDILDRLILGGDLQPVVAVLTDNIDHETRMREYGCNPDFVEHLVAEILPWAREKYRVTDRPEDTLIAGASMGGLAAAYAALLRPDVFGNVLSQSGSFWWRPPDDCEPEWLARQYVESPPIPVRFYLEVGLQELMPTPDNGPTQVVVNRHMRNVLRAKGHVVHYVECDSGHAWQVWKNTLGEGLLALAGKRGVTAKS